MTKFFRKHKIVFPGQTDGDRDMGPNAFETLFQTGILETITDDGGYIWRPPRAREGSPSLQKEE